MRQRMILNLVCAVVLMTLYPCSAAYAQICQEDYERCKAEFNRGIADGTIDDFLSNYLNQCLGKNPTFNPIVSCKQLAPQSSLPKAVQAPVERTDPQPSFDCSKATSGAAILICSDGELSKLDRRLGAAYAEKMKEAVDALGKTTVRNDQLAWIRQRNKECGVDAKKNVPAAELVGSRPCMIKSLTERISQLGSTESNTKVVKDAASPSNGGPSDAMRSAPPKSLMEYEPEYIAVFCSGCGGQPNEPRFGALKFRSISGYTGRVECSKRDGGNKKIDVQVDSSASVTQQLSTDALTFQFIESIRNGVIQICGRALSTGKLLVVDPQQGQVALAREIPQSMELAVSEDMWTFLFGATYAPSPTGGTWSVKKNAVKEKMLAQDAQARAQTEARNAEQRRVERIRQNIEIARSDTITTSSDASFVDPVIISLRRRSTAGPMASVIRCNDEFEYIGGAVTGKSTEGLTSVVLMNITIVNKASYPQGQGGLLSGLCGNAIVDIPPGARGTVTAKALFRKYDTGWRLEQVLQ
jgi:uncharacterized protein YecT (DUF1311 family)